MLDLLFNVMPLLTPVREKVGDAQLARTLRYCADLIDSVNRQNQKPTAEEIAYSKTNKIGAIKMLRERTGISLKDAKDMIDGVTP